MLSGSTAGRIQLRNKLTDEEKVALVLTLVIVQSSGILVVSNFMNEADGTGLLFSLFLRLVVLAQQRRSEY